MNLVKMYSGRNHSTYLAAMMGVGGRLVTIPQGSLYCRYPKCALTQFQSGLQQI